MEPLRNSSLHTRLVTAESHLSLVISRLVGKLVRRLHRSWSSPVTYYYCLTRSESFSVHLFVSHYCQNMNERTNYCNLFSCNVMTKCFSSLFNFSLRGWGLDIFSNVNSTLEKRELSPQRICGDFRNSTWYERNLHDSLIFL